MLRALVAAIARPHRACSRLEADSWPWLETLAKSSKSHATASGRDMRVAASNWRDVEAALQAGATAILPVGATAKQHGLRLPMNADFLQAEWLVRRLAELAPVIASPTASYEHYPAFRDYSGSCSLSRGIFTAPCTEIINDVVGQAAML